MKAKKIVRQIQREQAELKARFDATDGVSEMKIDIGGGADGGGDIFRERPVVVGVAPTRLEAVEKALDTANKDARTALNKWTEMLEYLDGIKADHAREIKELRLVNSKMAGEIAALQEKIER